MKKGVKIYFERSSKMSCFINLYRKQNLSDNDLCKCFMDEVKQKNQKLCKRLINWKVIQLTWHESFSMES